MPPFEAQRNVQTGIMQLKARPRDVFPLLWPQREYEWLPIWQCRMIYSETGIAENNAVFYTDFGEDRGPEWWTIVRYEPCRAIEFVRFSPGRRISRLDIHLIAQGTDATLAIWTQTLTALSPEGNATIEKSARSRYSDDIKHLESMLNHYLQTGTAPRMPAQAEPDGGGQA